MYEKATSGRSNSIWFVRWCIQYPECTAPFTSPQAFSLLDSPPDMALSPLPHSPFPHSTVHVSSLRTCAWGLIFWGVSSLGCGGDTENVLHSFWKVPGVSEAALCISLVRSSLAPHSFIPQHYLNTFAVGLQAEWNIYVMAVTSLCFLLGTQVCIVPSLANRTYFMYVLSSDCYF